MEGTLGGMRQRREVIASWLLTIAVTTIGLQLMRVFIPTLLFYLGEVVGASTIALGLIALALFSTTFLSAALARVAGMRPALAFTAGGTALLRAAEQLSRSVPLDMALSAAGVALFLLYLPLALGAARARTNQAPGHLALALLAGVAADTAIHIGAATYDLSWQSALLATVVALALSATALIAFRQGVADMPAQAVDLSWRRATPLLAIGPWLMLQLIIFQSVARTAAVSGWSLPLAGLVVTLGNILGLIATWQMARLSRQTARVAPLVAGIFLIVIFIPQSLRGPAAAALILAGQPLSAILLASALSGQHAGREKGRTGLAHTTVMYGLGFILFTALLFAYYASYDLALGFRAPAVLPVAPLLMTLGVALALSEENPAPPHVAPSALGALLLLLALAPLFLWLARSRPRPATTPPGSGTIRFMTYNLHNGFDVTGRLDLEALAGVIEGSGADVVALQEVSRGWVTAGSVDMLSWLAQRLGMSAAFGPTTADGQWGNAILSRYPIIEARNVRLPPPDLLLTRGYLAARVDIQGQTLRVLATHLHHVASEPEPRRQQVQVLLEAWGARQNTVLAGDLNARPGDPEMRALAESGLLNVTAALTSRSALTYPSASPQEQIDYVWISPEVEPGTFAIPGTTASDHLPLVVELRIP